MIARAIFELEVPAAEQQDNEELILRAVDQLEEYAIEFATDQELPASRVKAEHHSIPYLRLTKYRFSVEVTPTL